jgi:hypothetical protein
MVTVYSRDIRLNSHQNISRLVWMQRWTSALVFLHVAGLDGFAPVLLRSALGVVEEVLDFSVEFLVEICANIKVASGVPDGGFDNDICHRRNSVALGGERFRSCWHLGDVQLVSEIVFIPQDSSHDNGIEIPILGGFSPVVWW